MNIGLWTLSAMSLGVVGFSNLATALGDFAPPKVSLVDSLGVNLVNGQITQSLNTVSIGGSMGLSHSISAYTNQFSFNENRGYQDKFYAKTRPRIIGENVTGYGFLDVINVHDFEDSVDFIVKVNGQRVSAGYPGTSGYTFESLGDERHTLTVGSDGYLNWTKPNGTLVRFRRAPGVPAYGTAVLETVTYPNNFTIKVDWPYKVTTNTGFTLKYIYVEDNGTGSSSSSQASTIPPLPVNLDSRHIADCAHMASWDPAPRATYYLLKESSPQITQLTQVSETSKSVSCSSGQPDSNKPEWVQACNTYGCGPKAYFSGMRPDPLGGTTNVPVANPLGWSQSNPRFIQAINSATENCDSQSATCNMNWPKATFIWPEGMPRSMFYGENYLKVTDAEGGVTQFRFKSHDLAYMDEACGAQCLIADSKPGQRLSPRLVGVKPAGSSQETIKYTYKNAAGLQFANDYVWYSLTSEAGVIKSATRIDGGTGYTIGEAYNSDSKNSASSKYGGIFSVMIRSPERGTLNTVEAVSGNATYELGFRNFVSSYAPLGGQGASYTYTRGNLTKITYSDGVAEASYPASCDSSNYKYCNKPSWTSDKKGNKTYYQYHTLSGEVERITFPAAGAGIPSAVKRYTYGQKRAKYFQNGTKTEGTPIWLKIAEKTCSKTATSGDACAGGATDEVITTFEYDHDNLLMTGTTVVAFNAAGVSETKRTCYQYDNYGNRIGETQPKAARSSCAP